MRSRNKFTYMIFDLQFGSTGKGLLAGYLAEKYKPDTVVTAWAANAGHTYIDSRGKVYVHTMLANGIVSPALKQVLIGPGSVIDPINLHRELSDCGLVDGSGVKILIHPHAAVIDQSHRDAEAGSMTKIGSTKKGVGAAAITRIQRDPDSHNCAFKALLGTPLESFITSVEEYSAALDDAEIIQIEGAQGYSLSMYHGFYPFTTSRDVTPAQVMADCGIPLSRLHQTFGTMRTFPIRVANRYNQSGEQIGYSGPCYPDQFEISWDDLGMEPELTTVTKLPRRIFSFSMLQMTAAVRQCEPNGLFLNFANYIKDAKSLIDFVIAINTKLAETADCDLLDFAPYVRWLGFGPTVNDVVELPPTTDFAEIWDALPYFVQTGVQ